MQNRNSLLLLSDVKVRHGFIRKVYGILVTQLAVTILIGGFVLQLAPQLNAVLTSFLMFSSMAVTIIILCFFACSPGTMRSSPGNYIALAMFTVAESVLVGFISAQYTQESVLLAMGITCVTVAGLTAFAFQTKQDFTGFGPYLLVALLVLTSFSFLMCIGALFGLASSPAWGYLRLVMSAFGALLMSFFIVYDTQLMLGGKHTESFGIDDYIMAALCLYTDIINLFLYILQMLGQTK